MSDDIVERLRTWIPCYRADTDIAVDMAKAADEIERLNACVAEANAYMAEAALAIERLRAERDEIERLHQLVSETDKLRTELADAKRQLSQHALDRLALLDERIGLE